MSAEKPRMSAAEAQAAARKVMEIGNRTTKLMKRIMDNGKGHTARTPMQLSVEEVEVLQILMMTMAQSERARRRG